MKSRNSLTAYEIAQEQRQSALKALKAAKALEKDKIEKRKKLKY